MRTLVEQFKDFSGYKKVLLASGIQANILKFKSTLIKKINVNKQANQPFMIHAPTSRQLSFKQIEENSKKA